MAHSSRMLVFVVLLTAGCGGTETELSHRLAGKGDTVQQQPYCVCSCILKGAADHLYTKAEESRRSSLWEFPTVTSEDACSQKETVGCEGYFTALNHWMRAGGNLAKCELTVFSN